MRVMLMWVEQSDFRVRMVFTCTINTSVKCQLFLSVNNYSYTQWVRAGEAGIENEDLQAHFGR